MVNFDFETNQATPEWLTSVLSRNGFLLNVRVLSIEQTKFAAGAFISNFVSLRVTYSPGSLGSKPQKIILKAIKPELVESEKHRELNFYNLVFDIQTELPLLTCFGTEICPETNQYCLLLEDLTTTHHQSPSPIPPHQSECEEAIAVLASIHAYWWGHPPFDDSVFVRPSENQINGYFQYCASVFYPKFFDFLGDRLPENRRKIYELVFKKAPKLFWDRISPYEKQTLTHGDAHFLNFLYPNNEKDRCVIFDWQSCGIRIGAKDLAYMIAFQWYRERRQRMELPLLKHYHIELLKRQIHYTWEDLLYDYRVFVITNLLYPVEWHFFSYPPRVWWDRLEKGFAAFEDLDCLELLK